jgi:hypothetical protein
VKGCYVEILGGGGWGGRREGKVAAWKSGGGVRSLRGDSGGG